MQLGIWFAKIFLGAVYNDHPWDPKIVAVVDKWSLFRGHLHNKFGTGTSKLWSLLTGGHYLEVVVSSGLTVTVCLALENLPTKDRFIKNYLKNEELV